MECEWHAVLGLPKVYQCEKHKSALDVFSIECVDEWQESNSYTVTNCKEGSWIALFCNLVESFW